MSCVAVPRSAVVVWIIVARRAAACPLRGRRVGGAGAGPRGPAVCSSSGSSPSPVSALLYAPGAEAATSTAGAGADASAPAAEVAGCVSTGPAAPRASWPPRSSAAGELRAVSRPGRTPGVNRPGREWWIRGRRRGTMGARAGLGSGCGSLRPRSIRSGHGPRTRRRRDPGRRRRTGLRRGRGGFGPDRPRSCRSRRPPRAPPRGSRVRPGTRRAVRESPAPGGVVLVMSPGLALRQVGSRESSSGGLCRAGLARREVRRTASR